MEINNSYQQWEYFNGGTLELVKQNNVGKTGG
jgi:hypothetical protein